MKIIQDARDHPVRAFALVCVAFIACYIGLMAYWINETLAGPDWCARALRADQMSPDARNAEGLKSCIELLTIQLKSLATNSHILFGSLALCLVTLIVIVIAKGKLTGSAFGSSLDIGGAAQEVADSAQDTADVISDQAGGPNG